MLPHRLTPAVVSHAKGVYADVNWHLPSVAVTVGEILPSGWYFQSHPLPAKHVGTQGCFICTPIKACCSPLMSVMATLAERCVGSLAMLDHYCR